MFKCLVQSEVSKSFNQSSINSKLFHVQWYKTRKSANPYTGEAGARKHFQETFITLTLQMLA